MSLISPSFCHRGSTESETIKDSEWTGARKDQRVPPKDGHLHIETGVCMRDQQWGRGGGGGEGGQGEEEENFRCKDEALLHLVI